MGKWEKFKNLLGENKVKDSEEERLRYARDECKLLPLYLPDLIIHPENAQEVVKVLKLAQEEGIPVTPRGAGTGLSGGAVAMRGGIILLFDRMDKIKDIDRENLHVICEPGVITGMLHQELEKLNLFYPPDPASLENCTLGGNIAENAGGPRCLKYGVTKHYVLELEVILPDGTLIRVGKKTKKWVTGYDLVSLLVGSEGTLGVITEATLRLLPLPASKQSILLTFNSEITASQCATRILSERLLPSALEFVGNEAVRVMEDKLPFKIPSSTQAVLLVEFDGEEETVTKEIEKCASLLDKEATLILGAMSKTEEERLWKVRRELLHELEAISPCVHVEDIVVPRTQIPTIIKVTRETKDSLPIVTYGHIGDGNLHLNFLYKKGEESKVEETIGVILHEVLRLGGTIAGEHGIGILKKAYVKQEQSKAVINLQKGIKQLIDPLNILNPGKIFP